MSDLNTLLAEQACQRLMVEYCHCSDTGLLSRNFDRLISLFAKDGVLARPDTGEIKGQAAIKAFFEALPTGVFIHSSSNRLVTVTGPETAEAVSYVTVFRSYRENATGMPKLEAPYLVAKYVDKFIVEEGEWKIAYRNTIFMARE